MSAKDSVDYIECEKPEMPDEAMIQKLNYLGCRVGYSSFGSGLKSDIDSLSGENPLHILESFFDIWDISSDLIEKIQKAGFTVDGPIREYLTRTVDCCSTGIKNIGWFVANGFVSQPYSLVFSVYSETAESNFEEIESDLEKFLEISNELYEKNLISFNPIDVILNFNRELASHAEEYITNRDFFLKIYSYTLGNYIALFDKALQENEVDIAITIFGLTNTAFRKYTVAARAVPAENDLGFCVEYELSKIIFQHRHMFMQSLQEKLRKVGREVLIDYGFC